MGFLASDDSGEEMCKVHECLHGKQYLHGAVHVARFPAGVAYPSVKKQEVVHELLKLCFHGEIQSFNLPHLTL